LWISRASYCSVKHPENITFAETLDFPGFISAAFPAGQNAAKLPARFTLLETPGFSRLLFRNLSPKPQPRISAKDRHPSGETVNCGSPSPAFHASQFRGSGFRAFVLRPFSKTHNPAFYPKPATPPGNRPTVAEFSLNPSRPFPNEHQPRHL